MRGGLGATGLVGRLGCKNTQEQTSECSGSGKGTCKGPGVGWCLAPGVLEVERGGWCGWSSLIEGHVPECDPKWKGFQWGRETGSDCV